MQDLYNSVYLLLVRLEKSQLGLQRTVSPVECVSLVSFPPNRDGFPRWYLQMGQICRIEITFKFAVQYCRRFHVWLIPFLFTLQCTMVNIIKRIFIPNLSFLYFFFWCFELFIWEFGMFNTFKCQTRGDKWSLFKRNCYVKNFPVVFLFTNNLL